MNPLIFLAAISACLQTQTPPIKPNLQEVPIPPAITLEGPEKVEISNAPITADEAARIAVAKSPVVEGVRQDANAAAGRTRQSRAGLNPSMSLSSAATQLKAIDESATTSGNRVGSLTQGIQSSLTVRLLVLDFNHARDLMRQATSFEDSAIRNITRAESDTALLAKLAFYTFAQNTQLVLVNEANVKSRQAQVDLAQARLDSGLGAPADLVQANTNLADAVQSLNIARNAALTSRISLAQTMGIDPRTPINLADTHEAQAAEQPLSKLVETALSQRPEIHQADDLIAAAKYGIGIARTTDRPSLSLSAGLSARGEEDPFRGATGLATLTLSWPISDGGLTTGRVQEAKANLRIAQAARRQTELTVIQDVSASLVQLQSAQQRVGIAQAEVKNAEESVRLSEGRYQAGLVTFIEVTAAQAALVVAQTNATNAVFAVDQARATLRRAVAD